VIGWMEDIRRLTVAEIRAFYDTYYVPNNAVLVVAGDVRGPDVLARVRRLFGGVRRGPLPPPVRVAEPPQLGERRITVAKAGAKLAQVQIAYHVPTGRAPDGPALELLSTLLSEGRMSRLHRRLVYEQQIATGVGGDYSFHSADPNLFWLYGTVRPESTPEAVERAL